MRLEGEDAVAFLQGLITNDANSLVEHIPLYAALLTPQGKYLHDFFLIPTQNGILLDCERARIPDLQQRLLSYKLRSKVSIAVQDASQGVFAAWGVENDGLPEVGAFSIIRDPREKTLGLRLVGDVVALREYCETLGWKKMSEDAYDAQRIQIGVPRGCIDMLPEKSFLMEFHFEDLHGVDFKKGCYVGQEVTTRMKYRGQLKKFLYQIRTGAGPLPEPGTPITAGELVVGEMRSHAGNEGLALIRLDELEKANASGAPLMAAGVSVDVSLPRWVRQAQA